MQIYNTISRQKEEFKPQNPPRVTFYTCGPTVYDYFHIGNARTFVIADIIRKYLMYKGYQVTYAMNLTDIDDKIIKKANVEGISTTEVTNKYIQAFFDDLESLNIAKADIFPKATEHIDDIENLIKKLEENGIAYNVDGNVFYNVEKFEGYGKLSRKKIDELESGSRVEVNTEKKNPLDFALWKKAKEGEPSWDSPWGNGRPGWHIECSAMSMKHLGETIDIHAGGNDLIFPHHENEIAQSEAATHKEFVKYWLHFGFLNLDNEKMSKSLGNFFTARDILKKYDAETIRFLFIQSHYRGPLNFTEELIQSAKKGVERIFTLGELIKEKTASAEEDKNDSGFDFNTYYTGFEEAMDDDFNTPQAAAVLFDFVKAVNTKIASGEILNYNFYSGAKKFLTETADKVFGIFSFEDIGKKEGKDLEQDLIELLISLRIEAKKEKNFALADKIRDNLSGLGITLKDSKEGTTYKKEK